MSCKISRRNFMKCAGVGALAAASAGLLGGCTKFDAEYGLHEVAAFTNKKGGSFSLAFTEAREITATQNADLAEKYQLKTDEGQRYVYLLAEVTNGTGGKVDLYDRRFKWDIINNIFNPVNYDDEDIRKGFYQDEEDEEVATVYPNANQMVKAPTVLWAYNNGMYLSGKFGVVCYTGEANEPRAAATYADIPQGSCYLSCIGQITENLQTLRIVYRASGKEVNFVITPDEFE